MASIADEARVNMLAELILSEPQPLSNIDLMKLVIEDVGQTLITVTDETAAVQYWRYLKVVRDS